MTIFNYKLYQAGVVTSNTTSTKKHLCFIACIESMFPFSTHVFIVWMNSEWPKVDRWVLNGYFPL